jgi:hypothetical protein
MIKLLSKYISFLLKYDVFIILLTIFSILPFILISYFNQPSADDYCYAAKAHNLGFWNAQINSYLGWTGRYLSTFLLSFDILVKGKFILYKLFPVVLILSLFKSFFNLISLLFVGLSKKDVFIITSLFVVVYFIQMPSISEGIYWFAGSMTYQLSNIISILFICSLIKVFQLNRLKHLFFAIIYMILLIGTNETSMVIWSVTLGSIFLYKSILSKKAEYHLLGVICVIFICSLLVILAPGNSVRGAYFPESHQFFNSIFQSLRALIINGTRWFPLLFILTLLLFGYLEKNTEIKSSQIFKVNPVLVFSVVCAITFLGFFISFWSMGNAPPLRTVNVISFYFMLGILYIMFILFFKYERIFEFYSLINKQKKYALMIVILGSIVCFNNIRGVYADLLLGTAYRYNLELIERYKIIEGSKLALYEIPGLKNRPRTLFVSDITTDAENWRNECFGTYFSEKVIVIKKEE